MCESGSKKRVRLSLVRPPAGAEPTPELLEQLARDLLAGLGIDAEGKGLDDPLFPEDDAAPKPATASEGGD